MYRLEYLLIRGVIQENVGRPDFGQRDPNSGNVPILGNIPDEAGIRPERSKPNVCRENLLFFVYFQNLQEGKTDFDVERGRMRGDGSGQFVVGGG